MKQPRFATVVLDVDSTLCGIEGIDWLAARKGADIAIAVAEQTDRAMRGEIPLENVYAERLSLVKPTREDVEALGSEYVATLSNGAANAIGAWTAAGVRVLLVSSAIRQALLHVASEVGLPAAAAHAVDIEFDAQGNYAGFDRSSPLATGVGKRETIDRLNLPRQILMVGDGVTDLAASDAVDAFAAYTGFVSRETIVAAADFVVSSFEDLSGLVLSETRRA